MSIEDCEKQIRRLEAELERVRAENKEKDQRIDFLEEKLMAQRQMLQDAMSKVGDLSGRLGSSKGGSNKL